MGQDGRNGRSADAATRALAAAIREAQGAANVKGAELARMADIPYSTFRKIRTGSRAIDWEELRRIAAALKIPVSRIAARAEEIERSA